MNDAVPEPAPDPLVPDGSEEALADQLDDPIPAYGYERLPMIGLGGSAGGIQALVSFFEGMPVDSGMAFVVVIHLAPDRESSLAELLQRATTMPVLQVAEAAQVHADHVYVIPPGKSLASADGALRLADMNLTRDRGKRSAVDFFFRTLADTHGPHAAAIVLSGADGDGSIGVKRIKERGGLTISQEPDEAEHPGMPRSAITTGMVDWVLPVAAMPARLIDYFGQEKRLRLPPEEGLQPAGPPLREAGDDESALREVLAHLRSMTGHDFSYYKRATILRRIGRRMQVNGADDMRGYLEVLRTRAGEGGALLQDLLISVTNFFRDAHAFDALRGHLGRLFDGKKPGDTVRVWVAACATGEEAYSVAMLLQEHAATLEHPPKLQVFATDLDEDSIHTARTGVYPRAIVADVSPERLRRFFVEEPGGYRVRGGLREVVLFALHDLLKDSPFSRLDLVTCRNLLIYLNRDAQARAVDIFHFGLRLDGVLFLGTSESLDEGNASFSVLDKRYRVYAHRQATRAAPLLPRGAGTLARVQAAHARGGPTIPRDLLPVAAPASTLPAEPATTTSLHHLHHLHHQLIEMVSPPSVLINSAHDILHLSEGAGRFLRMVGGAPTGDLLRLVHPMLRIDLRVALFKAAQTGARVEVRDLPMEDHGINSRITLRIQPAPSLEAGCLLVVFDQRVVAGDDAAAGGVRPATPSADPVARQLEHELEQMKAHLRDTVEQYEASTEELKASNEELQAMNEELRSATEELETGREESQSTNEELVTVNQELKSKVDELARANSDLHNLMGASAIATIFLDRELRIARYTPMAVQLVNLIPADLGRPLTDLTHRLAYPELAHDAARVLAQLSPIEREVTDVDGRWFLARALPYRTMDDHIAGVVLTFIDVSERRRSAEAHRLSVEALQLSDERLRLVVENARDYAILSTDPQRRITTWSAGAAALFGYDETEVTGQPIDLIFVPEDRAQGLPAREAETALQEGRAVDDRLHLRKDGSRFWASGVLMPMRNAAGKNLGLVKILRDQTEARASQEALERSRNALVVALGDNEAARALLEAASNAKDQFLAVLSHELRTPLTPVMMAVQILERRSDLSAPVRSSLEMIRRNIRIESRLIDDLLDLTLVSRGTFEIYRQPMDVHAAIRGAVEVTEADMREKGQHLTLSLQAAEHHLQGDFDRLQQVFWNLLKNASKFTPSGGNIGLSTFNDAARFVVTVVDDGVGIEAAALPWIFDAFRRGGESISKRYGGLGLGLAIAQATVKRHDGALRAESPGPGRGAGFTVELPLDEPATPGNGPSRQGGIRQDT